MLGYEFEIIYKKWKKNVVAYALSRMVEDVEAFICAISIIQPDWITEARDEWKKEEEVWALIQNLQQDLSSSDTFSWKNDSLWYKYYLYLCNNSQLKQTYSFGIANFSFRKTLRIFKNLPQGEKGIFLGWP